MISSLFPDVPFIIIFSELLKLGLNRATGGEKERFVTIAILLEYLIS